jgi:hypothetical protein
MAFIDVDFPNQPQYVQGYVKKPRNVYRSASKRIFGDAFPVLNETERRDAANEMQKAGGGLSRLITRIYNQSNEGSCVGNMGGQGCEVLEAKCVGKDRVVPISAMSMYKQIGSSPNSGASVEDCIDRMADTGFLPLDTPENKARFKHTMSHTNFRQPWPSGWKDTAIIFANVEGFWCDTVAEMETALILGMPVGVGRAGHSILYLEPFYEGTTRFIDYVNSWGQWGFGKGDFSYGFGRDSSRLFNESADWCYAFQAADPSKWDWFTIGGTAA